MSKDGPLTCSPIIEYLLTIVINSIVIEGIFQTMAKIGDQHYWFFYEIEVGQPDVERLNAI